MKRVELLTPAKNLKAIKAASKYADSVYFGIEKFNMRMRSENIALEDLANVVDYCHERGITVQGELGAVPYLGELDSSDVNWDIYMTEPAEAERFVKETGLDTLAVAIGNAHGFLKEREEPDYERLQLISDLVQIPFARIYTLIF